MTGSTEKEMVRQTSGQADKRKREEKGKETKETESRKTVSLALCWKYSGLPMPQNIYDMPGTVLGTQYPVLTYVPAGTSIAQSTRVAHY